VRAAALRVGLVLGEPHLEVLRPAGEHAPHRSGLLAAEVGEDGVREARARSVARAHRVAVAAREGLVEADDQLVVGMRHWRTLTEILGACASHRAEAAAVGD
jgi:hypothetical protein